MADADDVTTGTSPFTPTPVIAEAWRRAKVLQLAYLRARGSADPAEVAAMAVELQGLVLLIAAEPARHMDDLEPKVLAAALFRGPMAHVGTHTLALIEHAIELDMDRLQPLDADLLALLPKRRTH